MATWQFDLHLIPRASVTMETGHSRLTSLDLDRERIINLESSAISQATLFEFCRGLSIIQSWSTNIKIWGDFEGDRIDVLIVNDRISEIFVRIDVRNISLVFMSKIVEFARSNRLVLLTSADQILEPSVKLLMNTIKRSSAFRFVLDPRDFLRKLNHNSADDD